MFSQINKTNGITLESIQNKRLQLSDKLYLEN